MAERALPELHIPFGAARPSLTHIALTELVRQNYVKYVVSQNVDGLHVRAGLKRKSQLAVRILKCKTLDSHSQVDNENIVDMKMFAQPSHIITFRRFMAIASSKNVASAMKST